MIYKDTRKSGDAYGVVSGNKPIAAEFTAKELAGICSDAFGIDSKMIKEFQDN